MGPMGLKGDEGPRGVPGDPAKGVRTLFHSNCINTCSGFSYLNLIFSITTDYWPNWKKGCQGKYPKSAFYNFNLYRKKKCPWQSSPYASTVVHTNITYKLSCVAHPQFCRL